MIVDLATEKLDGPVAADVAIVGSGPAGLSLARRLQGTGQKVVMLESGTLDYSAEIQELNQGEDAWGRQDYLHGARIRAFGGTSFHWGGWCRPLDESDFGRRDWIEHSSWPIEAAELAPFYAEAAGICDLDRPTFELDAWARERGQAPLDWGGDDFTTAYFQLSPPTRFGEKYLEEARAADDWTTLLNATVTGVRLQPNGGSCRELAVVGPDGGAFTVTARRYVLACGGIENARLLLISDDVEPDGVGNARGLVGRFFMDHPSFNSGRILLQDRGLDLGLYIYDSHPQFRGFGTIAPTVEQTREARSVKYNIELFPYYEGARNSYMSFKEEYWSLANRVKRGEVVEEFSKNLSSLLGLVEHGSEYAYSKLFSEGDGIEHVELRHHLECSPNPDSRVTLDRSKTDRLGQPLAVLDWRIRQSDFDGWLRSQEALAAALGSAGLGRLRIDQQAGQGREELAVESSFHHIGTTRMAAEPQGGVVDPDCRVHGVDNLYVVGSSVFPTCGHANPTLTVVALALRLGDHLRERSAS